VYVKKTCYLTAIGDPHYVTEKKLTMFSERFFNNSSFTQIENELYADCLRSIKDQPHIEHDVAKEIGSFTLIDSAPTAEELHNFYISCLGKDLYAKVNRLSEEIAAECDLKIIITEEFI
jgi:hypothetical protein